MHELIHPDDARLNEYADGALDDAAQAAVAAHLAACAPCAARLAAIRALFADLAALPDEPLAVDLEPAVLAQLPRRARVPAWAPRAVLAAQVLAAAVVLALSWPWLRDTLQQSPLVRIGSEATAALDAAAATFAVVWQAPQVAVADLLQIAADAMQALPALPGPALEWSLVLAGSALAWLLSNGVLLRKIAENHITETEQ